MDGTKTLAVKSPDNTLGVVSLVAGILGIILILCCPYLSVILGLVALICGILGWQQNQQYALVGMILGSIATLFGIIFAIVGRLILTEIISIIEQQIRYS